MPPGAITTLYVDFRASVASLDTDMQAMSKSLAKTGREFEKLGKNLTAALTLPIAAAGKKIFDAADSYQKAVRNIQVRTGAVGDSVKGLKKDFEELAGDVPNSFKETSEALSQVTIRTGLTGKSAQNLAKNFLELSNLTETDLNANLRGGLQLFDTWGVTLQDQIPTLNSLYRAVQESGGSITELISNLGNSDQVLQTLGFSLQESAALFTSFERGGVEAQGAIAGLSKAFNTFAKQGKDPRKEILSLLSALEKSPENAKLFEVAAGIFGKSSLKMLDAIREGRFHFQDYLDVIKNGKGTILDAAQNNRTFGEAIAQAFNKANIEIAKALGPDAFKSLSEGISVLGQAFAGMVKVFASLPPVVQAVTVAITGLLAVTPLLIYYLGAWAAAGAVLLKWGAAFAASLAPVEAAVASTSTELVVYNAMFAEAQMAMAAGVGEVTATASAWALLGTAFAGTAAVVAGVGVGMFAGAIASGYDFQGFLTGLGQFIQLAIPKAFQYMKDAALSIWNGLVSAFSELTDVLIGAFKNFLEFIGLGPQQISSICSAISAVWEAFVKFFTDKIDVIINKWHEFQDNFNRGLGVLADWAGADKLKKYSEEQLALAAAARKSQEEFDKLKASIDAAHKKQADDEAFKKAVEEAKQNAKDLEEAQKRIKKVYEAAGLPPPGGGADLNSYLKDTKKDAEEAAKAIESIGKRLADSKATAEIDKLKKSIDDLVGGVGDVKGLGSAANISEQLAQIGEKIRNKMYADEKANLDKLSGDKLAAAQKTIDEAAAYELQKYEQEIAPKMAEVDRKNHQETVNFYQGLLEDVITGTRFDWENQFKKAAAAIAAEFLANMVEANVLASNSFSDLFDGILHAFTKGLDSWFNKSGLGDVFGSSAQSAVSSGSGGFWDALSGALGFGGGANMTPVSGPAGAIGQNADGSFIYGAGGAAAGAESGGMFGNLGAGFSNSTASTGQMVAGYGAAAYGLYSHAQNFGKNSEGTGEAIGSAFGTAIGAYFGGPFGAAIGAQLGGIAGKFTGGFFSEKLTPNEKAIKKFEGVIEDTLKKSLGKTVNFVVGNIEQFAGPNWADTFWKDFGEKGGEQFAALGTVFEQMFDLESGVGGQIGALLAQNLAGNDLFESLDNIKLFMDSMGISIEQMNEALLKTAEMGKISWHEFESFRQSLEQIPAAGLAAAGNITGAFDQVLQSGGRGMQAIIGLKNIAVEAGEAGVTSFDQLKQYLLDAGYSAETVEALFQAFSQRGITSFEELQNASDPVLGGVIADMETLGVKWSDYAKDAKTLEDGVGDLADSIRDLSKSLKDIPEHITTEIEIHTTNTGDSNPTAAKKGAILKFAMGGVVNTPTMFPTSAGMGLMGEAGAEAIMPLSRTRKGALGVSVMGMEGSGKNYNIFIDATGAKAGVEHSILAAMESLRREAVMEAIEAVSNSRNRGGW